MQIKNALWLLALSILFLLALKSPLVAGERASTAALLSQAPANGNMSPEVFMSSYGGDIARGIGEAYQLTGLSDFVKGKMGEKFNQMLSGKMKEFAADAFQKVVEELAAGGKLGDGKLGGGKVSLGGLTGELQKSPEARAKIEAAIKENVKNWLPQAARELVRGELLKGVIGSEAVEQIQAMEDKIVGALDTTLNEKFDELGSQLYGNAISDINSYLNNKTMGALGVNVDVTDIKGTLDSVLNMKTAANALSMPLAEAFGASTVQGVRDRIETAFNGQLPPEAMKYLKMGPDKFAEYANMVKNSLPGKQIQEQLGKWKDKIFNMPIMTLPTGAYCGILGGVAASYTAQFISSCSGFGATCNYEFAKRAIEVTQVLIWQAENKDAVSLTIGNFLDLGKMIMSKYGGNFAALGKLNASIGKVKDQIAKAKEALNKLDEYIKKPIDKAQEMVNKYAKELQDQLLDIQDKLVGPLKDAKNQIDGAFGDIKNKFGDALGDFNGLPSSFGDLKKTLGIPDKPFGKFGDFNPIKEARKALAEINNKVSDKFAKVGTDAACSIVKVCGPKAEIKKEERVPAQNESKEGAFDPVYLHNGEFYINNVDLTIPGRGIAYEFARVYRSTSDFAGVLGHNWTHNYAERIMAWDEAPGGAGVTWVNAEGKKYFFKERTKGVEPVKSGSMTIIPKFESPAGVFHELYEVITAEGEEYVLRAPDGVRTTFDAWGFMTGKRDRFGNELKFVYGDGINLTAVVDTLGREIRYSYDNSRRLVKVTDLSGRTLTFEYDSNGDLIGVTSPATTEFPNGKTTRYRYSAALAQKELNHNLIMVMDPKGQIYLRNVYGNDGADYDKVVEQVYGDDKRHITAQYRDVAHSNSVAQDFSPANSANDLMNKVATRAWVKDKRGTTRIYEHNGEGNLLREWIVEDGKRVDPIVWYTYNEDGLRLQSAYPSGRYVDRTFDAKGNVTSESVCANPGTWNLKPETWNLKPETWNLKPETWNLKPETCRSSEYAYEPTYNEAIYYKNPAGELTKYEYTGSGALSKVTYSNGSELRYEYNDFGQRTSKIDQLGVVDRYEYYALPPLPQGEGAGVRGPSYLHDLIRDANGIKATWVFEYDKVGNITAITDADGRRTEYTVNALNQVTKEASDLEHGTWNLKRFSYDENDNITKIVVGDNKAVYEFAYDILDNLLLKRELVGGDKFIETKYEYDPNENLTKMTFPEENSVAYEYDARNRLISQTREGGARISLVYDLDGNVISVTDGVGAVTKYVYNGFGELYAGIDPMNVRKVYTRDVVGRAVGEAIIGADGKTVLAESKYQYDVNGMMTSRGRRLWNSDPANATWIEEKLVRDARGDVMKAIDANGAATELKYDGLGRVVAVVDDLGNVQELTYSNGGRLLKEATLEPLDPARGRHWNAFTYDRLGRLATATDALGNTTRYAYNDLDNLTSVTDPLGHTTRYEYDGLGRRTVVVQEMGEGKTITTRYEWDGNGRLTSLTDDNGNRTEYRYDAMDRLVEEKFADGKAVTYSYDTADRLISARDQNGNLVKNSYDPRGSMLSRAFERGRGVLGTTRQEFYYDGLGRLTYSLDNNDPDNTNDDAKVWYSYDSLSRLVGENQNGRWVVRNYDNDGNKTAVMYPSGSTYYRSYDPLGRVTQIFEKTETWNLKPETSIVSYKYQGPDKLVAKEFANGVKLAQKSDPLNQIVEQVYNMPSKQAVTGWKYKYNQKSLLIEDEDIAKKAKRNYAYDAANRLVGVAGFSLRQSDKQTVGEGRGGAESWTLDGVGNWLEWTKNGAVSKTTPNTMNAYTKFETSNLKPETLEHWNSGTMELIYDLNGNLTSDGELFYNYDALNRLIGVVKQDGSPVAVYAYDIHNRRLAKKLSNPETWNLKPETFYIYDGWDMVEEYEFPPLEKGGEGGFKQFLYGQNIDEPIRLTVFAGNERRETSDYYYISDRTNSVRALTDETGKVVTQYDYNAYGETSNLKPETWNLKPETWNDLGFTSRPLDPETGLIYMRNRYYSPKLGRFISRDPLGYKNTFYSASALIDPITVSYHDGANAASQPGFPYNLSYTSGVNTNPSPGPIYIGAYLTKPNTYAVQDMGLYHYALSNPLTYSDPLGLWAVMVDLYSDRRSEGQWTLVNNFGFVVDSGAALGRGLKSGKGSLDWTTKGGDTPTGIYKFGGYYSSTNDDQVLKYGRQDRMILEPIGGNALIAQEKYNRGGLRIHEGREEFYNDNGRLMNTAGCVRLSPQDMADLNTAVRRLIEEGDKEGTVYVDEFGVLPERRKINVVSTLQL